ncbi:MAG: DUF7455 domain-containing protein [Gammaproteobacteria bacterium]
MDTVNESSEHALTALDRCDRCGAQARVLVILQQLSELLFCSHHFTEHGAKLAQVAAFVHDERESDAMTGTE